MIFYSSVSVTHWFVLVRIRNIPDRALKAGDIYGLCLETFTASHENARAWPTTTTEAEKYPVKLLGATIVCVASRIPYRRPYQHCTATTGLTGGTRGKWEYVLAAPALDIISNVGHSAVMSVAGEAARALRRRATE